MVSSAFMTTPQSKLTFFNKSISCIVQWYYTSLRMYTGTGNMDLPFVKFDEQGIDFSGVL